MSRLSSDHLKKTTLVTAISLLALGAMLASTANAASVPGKRYAAFGETNDSYDGVAGTWNGADWQGLTCPNDIGFVNRVNEFINGSGATFVSDNKGYLSWVQIGHQKRRYYTNSCVTDHRFYWERQYQDSAGGVSYSLGTITGAGTSTLSHRYAIQRRTDGCASGQSWCWHFRIDDVTFHTCCSGEAELNGVGAVSAELECIWESTTGGCPYTGSVSRVGQSLTAKYRSSNTWANWSGRDSSCVDSFANMRGNWIDADDITFGANVTMSTLTNGC